LKTLSRFSRSSAGSKMVIITFVYYTDRESWNWRSLRQFTTLFLVYIPKDFYTREPRGYYDERDCEEAYRRANISLHGRQLTIEFARGSRKTPREMRGKDGNRYSPPRRGRYSTPENSYRPRRYSRSPSRNRSRSRSDYKRHDDEEDRRRSGRYRSRSRSTSRTPPERRKRSEQ
ncbi:5616_t:CDS:2, partial [Acaulospora morrowiae]